MIITASGEGCFKIQSGGVTILTEGKEGEKSRMKPDIFLRTSAEETELPDAGFVIKGPGEYELKEIEIRGFPPFTYLIKTEDMKMCVLSSGDEKVLDQFTNLDIVFALTNHTTGPLIRQLAPKLVITTSGLCTEIAKELGLRSETTDKVTIKKREVPADGMKLICLK